LQHDTLRFKMSQHLIAKHAKVISELIYSRFFHFSLFASLSTILSGKTPHLYKGKAKEEAEKKSKAVQALNDLVPCPPSICKA
jgi:hypothetical protein